MRALMLMTLVPLGLGVPRAVADPGPFDLARFITHDTFIVMYIRTSVGSFMWSGVYDGVLMVILAWPNLPSKFAVQLPRLFTKRGSTMMKKKVMVMSPPVSLPPLPSLVSPPEGRPLRARLAPDLRADLSPVSGLPLRLALSGLAPAIPNLTIAIIAPARRAVGA